MKETNTEIKERRWKENQKHDIDKINAICEMQSKPDMDESEFREYCIEIMQYDDALEFAEKHEEGAAAEYNPYNDIELLVDVVDDLRKRGPSETRRCLALELNDAMKSNFQIIDAFRSFVQTAKKMEIT